MAYDFKLKIDDLKVGVSESGVTYIPSTDETFTVKLHGLRFNRKIYQPGEIEAELSFVLIIPDGTKLPSVSRITKLLLKKDVELYINENNKIAGNYYVHQVQPMQKAGSSLLFVKLSIFSKDKLMTLNKYSKVYVAKKLGSDILNTERKNFTSENDQIYVDFSKMCMLKYDYQKMVTNATTSKSILIQIPSEFIHPYLVQYNESFYDFLARTANRCGEFLYFEDGKLVLGLKKRTEKEQEVITVKDGDKTETKTIVREKESAPIVITDYLSVTYQGITDSPFEVDCYSRDSIKDGQGKMEGTNYDLIEKNSLGYPHDTFPSKPVYNSELASDEYFFPLYANKFTSYARETGCVNGAGDGFGNQLFPIISKFASKSNDLVHFAADFVIAEGTMYAKAASNEHKTNGDGYDDYIKISEAEKSTKLEFGDGETCAVPFGTLSPNGWTTLNYYQDVRKHEEAQQKKMICIDMGTNYADVKLGDKIALSEDGEPYTVIQIQLADNGVWSQSYTTFDGGMSSKNDSNQWQRIYAIPYAKINSVYKPYPPVLDAPIIRNAEPQTAFVVRNNDPKYQGRVRIVYPWQTDSKSTFKDLLDAESVYAVKEKDLAKAKEKLALLQAEMKKLKKEKAELELDDTKKNQLISDEKDERSKTEKAIKAQVDLMVEKDKAITTADQTISTKQETISTNQAILIDSSKTESEKTAARTAISTAQEAIDEAEAKKTQAESEKADAEAEKKRLEVLLKEQDAHIQMLEDSKTDKTILTKKKAEIEVKNDKGEVTGGKQKEINDANQAIVDAGKALRDAKDDVDKKAKKCKSVLSEMASPWIRVSSPMATTGGGTFFKPNVGDEVLVNYDNGNIERPYVVGSLFSKNVLAPDERINRTIGPNLHRNASIAIVSPNGHGITFKDPGSGAAFFGSVYPGIGVINDYGKLDWPHTKDLAGGIKIGDRYGLYSIDMSSDKRSVKISSSLGTVKLDAFTGITITAPNGDVKIEGKNVMIKAGNNLTLSSGTNMDEKKIINSDTKRGKALDVFDFLVKEEILERSINDFVTPFVDLSLARTVLEVFLRPIEGTMLVKSKRYLKLEAGKGKAQIKSDRYSNEIGIPGFIAKIDPSLENYNSDNIGTVQQLMPYVLDRLKANGGIPSIIENFVTQYENNWDTAARNLDQYDTIADSDLVKYEGPNLMDISFYQDNWNNKAESWFNDKCIPNIDAQIKTSLAAAANAFGQAVATLFHHYLAFEKLGSHNAVAGESQIETDVWGAFDDSCKQIYNECDSVWVKLYASDHKPSDKYLQDLIPCSDDPFIQKTYLKRKWALLFLFKLSKKNPKYASALKLSYDDTDLTKDRLCDNFKWSKMISNIQFLSLHPFLGSLIDSLKDPFLKKIDMTAWMHTFRDKDMWADNEDGQILFSDSSEKTSALENLQQGDTSNYIEANQYTIAALKKALSSIN